MTKTRKLLIGLGVTAALLVPAGAVYAATDDSGANGANGRPASGMMAGDMQRDRDHQQNCDGTQQGGQQAKHQGRQGQGSQQQQQDRVHQQDLQGAGNRSGAGAA